MRFLFIRAEKANYPVTVQCRVLEVSRSGYYAFEKRGPSKQENSDRELTAQIREVHQKSRRTYGSPRVHRELREGRRQRVGRKRVARLMRSAGIFGRRRRKFCRTTDSSHGLPVAENLLNRRFEMSRPNLGWVADVTYIWTVAGWLYLAAILDLFSRRVVGYALSRRNDTQLALAALEAALRCRVLLTGLLHHTDQGSPYASDDYQAALKAHGIICSMSRRGDCWDNAVSESFFSTSAGSSSRRSSAAWPRMRRPTVWITPTDRPGKGRRCSRVWRCVACAAVGCRCAIIVSARD
jgi:putative transposase